MTLEEYVLWMQAIVLTAVAVAGALFVFGGMAIVAAREQLLGLYVIVCIGAAIGLAIAFPQFWPF